MVTTEQRETRAALYARVSTTNHGQDVGLQLDELRTVARQRGWALVDEYVDEGVSGTRETRPALDRMMNDARQGRFDVLLVWKIDRLGRSLRHLLSVLDDLRSMNIGFVSVRDAAIDTTTPHGRLMLAIVAAFAEFERSLIVERVLAGLENARRKGRLLGRPRRDVDVDRARRLLADGRTQRQVAMALRVPRATLRRALGRAENPLPQKA